ncbi:hypothetical protein WJX74_004947 [Apatococcus lobatus]|uniref:RING-type domain-containing protein n=1 Tax=Apatococcus lobatus TaxID=904363 RepID=A0AAW1S274_9CHLO
MARGKGGAKPHGQERPTTLTEKERQICPLCIEPLDPTEKRFFPCPCGYQVCLFCFRRLKEEFSNQCPGCRTVYGSDFDPGRRLRNEVKQDRPSSAADVSAVPLPGTLQRPPSPVVLNPSQPLPHKHLETSSEHEISRPELSPMRAASPAAVRPDHIQAEIAGQQSQPSALLQLSQGAPVVPDPDGAALLASTQQQVANGGLSVREAARLLVSFLRAKQAAADSASNPSSFYSNGLPGSSNGGGPSAWPLRMHAAKDLSFNEGLTDRQPASMGLPGSGGADGGLLSSLLGESRDSHSPAQAGFAWMQQQQQQQQPDDDLMRLLWGNQNTQPGSRQLSWSHDAQPNGRDAQMDGHVPLYARSKNGMQHDMKRWEQGEKANGVHGQNGFASASWLSPVSVSSELAAIAMSAPHK